MKRLLIQTQLSNYNSSGKFILECDSGYQMCIGRVREMLKLNPELSIDIMIPEPEQLVTQPQDINPDLWEAHGPEGDGRMKFISHMIIPNALVTRYDFNWSHVSFRLGLDSHKADFRRRYDAVYINDPMHLRNFKALFHLVGGYKPRFYVHSHFIDNPECPKFPVDASLWLGQVEAARRADHNFWQCESSMRIFFDSIGKEYQQHVVEEISSRSTPWDDGYSSAEINSPVNYDNVRFDTREFDVKTWRKIVIFVPNRIGGRGRSSDYTSCGRFMFDILPELRKHRQDFVVIAGNPSQKFSNEELSKECGPNGFINLVPDALTRDEFKYVAKRSHISLGLYNEDTYGGTVARECIDLGCLPMWLDNYEYSAIAKNAGLYPYLSKPDFSNFIPVLSNLIDHCSYYDRDSPWIEPLRKVVRSRCSYESTTEQALKLMQLT